MTMQLHGDDSRIDLLADSQSHALGGRAAFRLDASAASQWHGGPATQSVSPSGFEVRWDSSGIDFNGVGILATGAPGYIVRWGDGTQEFLDPNRDDDGDGTNEIATSFHGYNMDGVYDVTVVDRPNRGGTPLVHLRAFMSNNDPDGTQVKGTHQQDMVLTGAGDDRINTGLGNDWVDANDGNDTVNGGDGDDLLLGGLGEDHLFGGEGADYIGGREGLAGEKDKFFGQGGDDTFYSDVGKAVIEGGAGADTFGFSMAADSSAADGIDLITDFEQGTDRILMLLSDDSSTGELSFIGDAAFSHVGGEVRAVQSQAMTYVLVDLNGDGAADMQVNLRGAYTLGDTDFLLI